jgi:hypothetical protein
MDLLVVEYSAAFVLRKVLIERQFFELLSFFILSFMGMLLMVQSFEFAKRREYGWDNWC